MRPMLTLGLRGAAWLQRHAAPEARRRRRVHPHRNPPPRRRRRRLRLSPRQAHRQSHLGQSGERARRRFPVQPSVRADGRGRQPASPENPQPRVRGDRRRRGRAADHPAPDRHRRGAISQHHHGQDRGFVRRRLPDRAGRRRGGRRGRTRARKIRPNTSESRSSWSTTCSTMASKQDVMGKGVGDDFRDGKVTLPVILAYARGSEEERAFWRAAIDRRAHVRRRSGACDRAAAGERRLVRHGRARSPVRTARARCAGHLSRRQGQVGAGRSSRVRDLPRLLRSSRRHRHHQVRVRCIRPHHIRGRRVRGDAPVGWPERMSFDPTIMMCGPVLTQAFSAVGLVA